MVDYVENAIIWSLSREEIFDICWLNSVDFKWKVVADFWSWAWWFIEFLQLWWETKQYEVDPVYKTKETFDSIRTRTHDWYADIVNQAIASWAPDEMVQKERELVFRILQSWFKAPEGIFRVSWLSDIEEEIDVLFATSTVSSLWNPIDFLEEALQSLSRKGVIYIVEPIFNELDNFSYFLRKSASGVKWVTVVKRKDIWCAMIRIECKALKRVINISKRFKKAQN